MSVDVDVFEALVATGFQRGEPLAVSAAAGVGIGIASATTSWAVSQSSPVVAAGLIGAIDEALRPQWVWWSNETARQLIDAGVRVSKCWDLSAVHRLIFGGWASEPSRVWAMLHDLSTAAIPAMGQLDLMSQGTTADEGGDPEDPVRPDVHLRPEWTSGGWASTPKRLASWAATAFVARELQRERLARTARASHAEMTARSESVDGEFGAQQLRD